MEDILGKLFEGELKFNFRDIEEVPGYGSARRAIREQEDSFRSQLTPELEGVYESLMRQTLNAEYLLTVEAFRRGFAVAVQLLEAAVARQEKLPLEK